MQLFVNDLTVMDFSYLCPKRGMVGESWIVDVILGGALNEESMVQDFGIVKKSLKALIDDYIDHKLLIPVEHAYARVTHDPVTEQVQVDFSRPDNKGIHLWCPAEAYAFIYADEVTMQSVSDYLRDVIATHLPENVQDITLNLRTEHIETPFYHYTHGLKKHDGNCQRIAHGHRSKITIIEDNQPSMKWQQYWAQRWQDIYIGSSEDLVASESLQMQLPDNDLTEHFAFSYEASQGEFELLIPKSECEIIDTDSTVECLAEYILSEQKKQVADAHFSVVAFEGVGKGAMVNG
ncbi:6-carboxytetrahydropterin synthase [Aestuariibacter salexigens]|uniref:6-carboxytetrahydropterin synthase n=1 Tax=Aestuariibacter salexigens TaxID=226010 RepID=UPI000412CBBB|nr:6-carboxytetrahydropterin synthase [Aestuariibacter salexigens]